MVLVSRRTEIEWLAMEFAVTMKSHGESKITAQRLEDVLPRASR
jgi:hypothetical protein